MNGDQVHEVRKSGLVRDAVHVSAAIHAASGSFPC
jgi:hypothetical protein